MQENLILSIYGGALHYAAVLICRS